MSNWINWDEIDPSAPITRRHTNKVIWNPNSVQLAVASVGINSDDYYVDTKFHILNTNNSEVIFSISNDNAPIAGLAWNMSGDRIIGTDLRGVAKIWNTMNGELLGSHPISKHSLVEASWHPDGRIAVGGPEGMIYILDSNTGQIIQSIRSEMLSWMRWSPNGTKLGVASAYSGRVQILDALTFGHIQTIHLDTQYSVNASWSPDGTWIATRNGKDNDVQIWDAQTGQSRLVLQGHTKYSNGICWNPAGTLLATTSDDATVRIWDAMTGIQQHVIPAPDGVIETLQIDWSSKGKIAYGTHIKSWQGVPSNAAVFHILTPPV